MAGTRRTANQLALALFAQLRDKAEVDHRLVYRGWCAVWLSVDQTGS
jgi:hypothetical protein